MSYSKNNFEEGLISQSNRRRNRLACRSLLFRSARKTSILQLEEAFCLNHTYTRSICFYVFIFYKGQYSHASHSSKLDNLYL